MTSPTQIVFDAPSDTFPKSPVVLEMFTDRLTDGVTVSVTVSVVMYAPAIPAHTATSPKPISNLLMFPPFICASFFFLFTVLPIPAFPDFSISLSSSSYFF
jgi:hypothetical protein